MIPVQIDTARSKNNSSGYRREAKLKRKVCRVVGVVRPENYVRTVNTISSVCHSDFNTLFLAKTCRLTFPSGQFYTEWRASERTANKNLSAISSDASNPCPHQLSSHDIYFVYTHSRALSRTGKPSYLPIAADAKPPFMD